MRTGFRTCLYVVLVLAVIAAGCAKKPAPENVVTIGTILPLTGPAASFGKELQQGQEAAVEYINSGKSPIKNVRLKLVVEDGKGSPTDSVAAYRKLRSQGVFLMQTATSPAALALAPQAARDRVVLFADAAHPALAEAGPTIFRHSNTAPQEAALLAEFATNALKAEKVAVFAVQDDFGVAFRNDIRRALGSRLLRDEVFSKTDQDLRGVAQRVVQLGPDCVIVVGSGKNLGLLVRRLREAGFNGAIMANSAMAFPDAILAAGSAYRGIYHTAFDLRRDTPSFRVLRSTYQERYAQPPSDFALLGFNSVFLVASAASAGNESADAVARSLRASTGFNVLGIQVKRTGQEFLPALRVVRAESQNAE